MSQAHTTGKVLAGTVGAVGLLLATGQAANAASVTVKANDTVWGLAQKHGVSVKSIEKLNTIKALDDQTDLIYVGQKLQISGTKTPAKTATHSVATTKSTYTVKAGDTLWALADQYHTSVRALQKLNGLSGDLIIVGQSLNVPGATTGTKTATKSVAQPTSAAAKTSAVAKVSSTSASTTTQSQAATSSTATSTSASSTVSQDTVSASSSTASVSSSTATSSVASQAASSVTNDTDETATTAAKSTASSTATSAASSSSSAASTSTASASSSTATSATSTASAAPASASVATSSVTTSSSSTSQSAPQHTVTTGSTHATTQNTNAAAANNTTSTAAQSSSSQATSTASQSSSQATTSNTTNNTTTSNADLATGSVTGLALKLASANIPYVWGGSSLSGMDCSGLVAYVYQHAAGISLPHNTIAQEAFVTTHSVASAQPGDILFWGSRGATYHDAIYIGNNQYVAAPEPGQNVKIGTINSYFMPSFAGTLK